MKYKKTVGRFGHKRMCLWWVLCCSLFSQAIQAQTFPKNVQEQTGSYLTAFSKKEVSIGKIAIDSVDIRKNRIVFFANTNCSYLPFREDNVAEIYRNIKSLLPEEYKRHTVQVRTEHHAIEELIPLAFRTKKDNKQKTFRQVVNKPLVTRLSVPYSPKYGLQNRHIALWQSHGFYYESKLNRWEWQRARTFQTVEDLYTQSFVLPYLIPMLENAGANVLIPRERDIQTTEIIIDNDGCRNNSHYIEHTATNGWRTGEGSGFAHLRKHYVDFENPFQEGTCRVTKSIRKGAESRAEWIPDIPEKGRYAVYVSYRTFANSTTDARYTVYHGGECSEFSVNQQMGGGTWIYLGHFDFDKGKNDANKVVLSNRSSESGKLISVDAVKIGGGYGNIARGTSQDATVTANVKSSDTPGTAEMLPAIDSPNEISGYPRFTEAARYWMQWAGIPDTIYSDSQGKNDYTDDYRSRGKWVNYLCGGSSLNPKEKGLNIPIDLAFAFHSDAGTTPDDSIVGTLGIFFTDVYDGQYANGTSRYAARELTDLIQSQIVNDIRSLYEPRWSRRGMWDKPYSEARTPRVPTMLLELLSHQNFADMRYGIDPRFRFTVSRAIYKGMLRFICSQYAQKYVVQPLPVDHLRLQFVGPNEVELSWQAVSDPLESTAEAQQYIVYTRIGDGAFDNGTLVKRNSFRNIQSPGIIYSYKVTALNEGGESFPSEILSAARAVNEKGTVLIVNGFDRISAPADFTGDSIAGFTDWIDHGVPYIHDISYVGPMKEFRRSTPWVDDDAAGFGDSHSNCDTLVIAGNTFDYPSIHGYSILKAGYSFVSCSNEAIESKQLSLSDYPIVDLILGKQRQTKMGRGGVVPLQFKTFSTGLQEAITAYCQSGGHIFVSGAYVGSDLWDHPAATPADREFATNTLRFQWRTGQAAITGEVKSAPSPFPVFSGRYDYHHLLNKTAYVVESPDGIEPAGEGGHTILRYAENNISAGVAYQGKYKTCILGFPFESVRTGEARDRLMQSILTFFNQK